MSSKPSESAFTRVRPLSPPTDPPPPPARSTSHHHPQPLTKSLRAYHSTTAAVQPNNALIKQRTISMPQLIPAPDTNPGNHLDNPYHPGSYGNRLPRQELPVRDREEIVNALKSWQRGRMENGENVTNRWSGEGRASIASTSALQEFGNINITQYNIDTCRPHCCVVHNLFYGNPRAGGDCQTSPCHVVRPVYVCEGRRWWLNQGCGGYSDGSDVYHTYTRIHTHTHV